MLQVDRRHQHQVNHRASRSPVLQNLVPELDSLAAPAWTLTAGDRKLPPTQQNSSGEAAGGYFRLLGAAGCYFRLLGAQVGSAASPGASQTRTWSGPGSGSLISLFSQICSALA